MSSARSVLCQQDIVGFDDLPCAGTALELESPCPSNGGLYALPRKLIERRKRHPGLALPAFWFAQASAVLSFRYGWDEAPVGVYGLEGAFFGGYVVGERPNHGALRHG